MPDPDIATLLARPMRSGNQRLTMTATAGTEVQAVAAPNRTPYSSTACSGVSMRPIRPTLTQATRVDAASTRRVS